MLLQLDGLHTYSELQIYDNIITYVKKLFQMMTDGQQASYTYIHRSQLLISVYMYVACCPSVIPTPLIYFLQLEARKAACQELKSMPLNYLMRMHDSSSASPSSILPRPPTSSKQSYCHAVCLFEAEALIQNQLCSYIYAVQETV